MKNKILYLFLAVMMTLSSCMNQAPKTANKGTKAEAFAPLKERNQQLAMLGDWNTVKAQAAQLQAKIQEDSSDLKSKILLAQLYMQEARVTGEHPYYYPATLTILDNVISHDNRNFEALAFKASVLLSLHHFKEALVVGIRAKEINPNNSFIYGILCDANVELGNYDEAVRMSDKMQSIRPGLESYSRASYLREIYGDNQGAIEAMKLAFQAGLPGSEEASWAGNTLSHLLENTNDLEHAEELAHIILEQRPSYAFATDALGRIELAKGHYDQSIALFQQAIKVMPEFSFYEHMAQAYQGKGETTRAKEIYKQVISMLAEDAQSGHYADMELAHVYLELGDLDNAFKHANIEYKRRPQNIDVNSTIAWVYYAKGNVNEAKRHMDVAMRMGTQNAVLLAKASIIEKAVGNTKLAQEYSARSRKINQKLPAELSEKLKA
jgi:tetratricopeptide (TPR) repeat protein